jgi:hypothetical protein
VTVSSQDLLLAIFACPRPAEIVCVLSCPNRATRPNGSLRRIRSASGQNLKSSSVGGRSASRPTADFPQRGGHVRFGPDSDIPNLAFERVTSGILTVALLFLFTSETLPISCFLWVYKCAC